jgi:hypothetical protein
LLRIDAQRDVVPKGSEIALRIYEVGGISGKYNIALNKGKVARIALAGQIPITYRLLESKNVKEEILSGSIIKLSKTDAEMALTHPVDIHTNLKMGLSDVDQGLSTKPFYGKVVQLSDENEMNCTVRFTSVPPEIEAYFQALRTHYT